ncbi:hypothetical protein [Microbacterium oleivorans]|uniref:Uncharacterized protein n=1 Tax=Microbacterium oleivorans TaxID=273677 RepID=A0A4R5YLQ2_9MICO|nr:hypothetical protein [Microbacterium oleivorans]TDL46444.1 hypothetical protein E2R54_07605 [Microbacterium oleivorans]
MRSAGRVWRALGATFVSGEYFTRWSLLLALAVGVLLSVPSVGSPSFGGYLRGVTVAALGSPLLVTIGLAAAWAERRLTNRAARAFVVAGAIGAISGIRPFVNDAISTLVFATSTGGNWTTRITTNLVTCIALFTVCAVAITYHRRLRATTERLQLAGVQMRAGIAEVRRLREAATAARHRLVDELRTSRDDLLASPVTYERVRDYSNSVRAASHHLDSLPTAPAPGSLDDDLGERRRLPLMGRLGATPPLAVGLTYVAATLPFGLAHGGPSVAATAIVACVAIDLVAFALLRAARRLRPRLRGIVFLAVWLAAGAAVMALTFTLIPAVGSLGLVPLLGVPLVAAVISLSVDAYRRARIEERRATTVLLASARRLAAEVDTTTAPLQRAIDVLHGRLQGRCVILAAHVDENVPDVDTLEAFRTQTDDILDEVRTGDAPTSGDGEDIDDLVRAWSVVMDVTLTVADDAREGLSAAAIADGVHGLVNEALVNAVKHSGARWADIKIDRDGDAIAARVSSPGILAATTPSTGERVTGIGTRGARTVLRQAGDRVVLEGLFPLPSATNATT